MSRIFTKVVLEAPLITESALEVIRRYCEDEVSSLQIRGVDKGAGLGTWSEREGDTSN